MQDDSKTNRQSGPGRIDQESIVFETPVATDGVIVHDLIAHCPPLDQNSLYANILQCTHFADTCLLAKVDGEVVGWLSGYTLPTRPDVYFVWQVAVSPIARGLGLGRTIILKLLETPACSHVQFVQATITEDNASSWKLFRGLADHLNAPFADQLWLDKAEHFDNKHDSEYVITIGPIPPATAAA